MLSKGEVITRIGEELWEEFETFAMDYKADWDEYGFRVYHPQTVSDFLEHNKK